MLPNESLLVVLHFADYRTVVLAKLAERRFLRLGTKFAEELARRRTFHVCLYATRITCTDETIDARRNIQYEPGSLTSLAAACREVAKAIGPHAVAQLFFFEYTWNMLGVGAIFEAAPPLKYAEEMRFPYSFRRDAWLTRAQTSEAFMGNFAGIKPLRLYLEQEVFLHFSWTFLRQESARELQLIKVYTSSFVANENVKRSIAELVRECCTLPHLLGRETLELDFLEYGLPIAFGQRIFELLKGSGREVAFRMKTERYGLQLTLDDREYTVEVDDTSLTRRTSVKLGIVVEAKGNWLTIKSTATVPPTRRSRRNTRKVCQ